MTLNLTEQEIADAVFEKLFELITDVKVKEELLATPMAEWELVNKGLITEQSLLEIYRDVCGYEALEDDELDAIEKFEEVNFDYLQDKSLLPLSWDSSEVVIVISSPYVASEIVSQWLCLFDRSVLLKLARRSVIERKTVEIYQDHNNFGLQSSSEESLRDLAKEAPIVRLVNDVFARAIGCE
jgi:hypothetical protein